MCLERYNQKTCVLIFPIPDHGKYIWGVNDVNFKNVRGNGTMSYRHSDGRGNFFFGKIIIKTAEISVNSVECC